MTLKSYSFFIFLLFFSFFLTLPSEAFSFSSDLSHTPPFGIITGHKSGSHLIMKCVELLQDRTRCLVREEIKQLSNFNKFHYPNKKNIEIKMHKLIDDSQYFEDHAQISSIVKVFSKKHPEFPWIVGIRDLRDAIVSQTYYFWEKLEQSFEARTLEEKITFLLNKKIIGRRKNIPSIYHHAKNVLKLLNLPNVLVIRFEDLVGSKGGGNDLIQAQTITKIAAHIGASLPENKLKAIQSVLFGDTVFLSTMTDTTFRSGKIGSWRNCLTPTHIKYFNKHYAHLQKSLGYTLD